METSDNMETQTSDIGWKSRLLALSPLMVFICIYVISSVIAGDFYKIPLASAFLIASAYAMIVSRGKTIEKKIEVFSHGAGNGNVLLMLWIFILAGAFAETARQIGAIDAAVGITLAILPQSMLYAGIFIASCFISISIGTSVGTIVALVPVAAGIASQSGIDNGFITAIVAGGAFFGDNLSFISDTTIAATRTQGCSMSDKFRVNLKIVAPAAVFVSAIYLIMGHDTAFSIPEGEIHLMRLIPYFLIIGLAISGVNVITVLATGILANAIIGFAQGTVSWSGWLEGIGNGIAGMGDLIIVTMLSGGMLEMIRYNGGIDWLVKVLTMRIRSRKGAELSIAALVSMANVCTANNTIAILTTGGIAHDITKRFGIDPRKTASILDTFSCMVQGLLPYGAQMLMASGLAGIPAFGIIRYLFYPYMMGICALLAIFFRYPRKYS